MNKHLRIITLVILLITTSISLLACGGKNKYEAKNLDLKVVEGNFGGTNQKQLEFSFELNKDLNLDDEKTNIKIAYFTVVNNEEKAINNTTTNQPLVKDKGWAGFLFHDGQKHVKGTPNASDYNAEFSNKLLANTKYTTGLRKGTASDNTSMEYHALDFNSSYKFRVKLTIESNGKKSHFEKTYDYNPN